MDIDDLAGSASVASIVSTDPACSPVKEADAWTETLYKYIPFKNVSDGPTQWDTVPAPAGTHKDYVVKGKLVDYVSWCRTLVDIQPWYALHIG